METADSAALLLLDLPQAALAGIDLLSFTTTPRFRGVKNIPPSFHFAFVGTSTAFSERHGVWIKITSSSTPPLIIAKWDAATESLSLGEDEAEVLRWRANLGSIWREGLTPYRQVATKGAAAEPDEDSSDWDILTSRITETLLTRITGTKWHLTSASSSKRDLEDIPGLNAKDLNLEAEQELYFLPLDLKQTWREGATGRERTDAAQDRSWALNNVVEQHCTNGDAMEIVGEMQFCFIMILTINNFSCLEQWKRILSLLFTCKSAVATNPDLFIAAIAALRLQVQHCKDAEGGLIDLADESGSLLKGLLVRFRKGVETLGGIEVQHVVDELDDLEDYLREEHNWRFGGAFAKTGVLELEDGEQVRMDTTAFDEDDETGEFAPQIVDLTTEQARMLNLPETEDLHVSLSRTSLKEVQSEGDHSDDDDDDDTEDNVSAGGNDSSDESEDEADLDDMDTRY
ncbi:uncharacterized protein LTR77_005401 [Saxophila tyrrhenica]|uniref:Uncharacterized protein n=1 Tax=Saxophila tyrrhenica TaxID=1690608 RepID=A0AAV9P902_9PEZI|nr:hypothetical protein LTR77_005401 [Saxophila tyrrhenica]